MAFRGAVFRVAGIYAPNRNPDCDDIFVCCVNAVDPTVPTLLWGDFNTVLDRVVVSWISGGNCILVSLLLLGVGPMGPLLPALTSLVARMFGCLICLLWTFYPAPSLIIVPLPFLGPFPTLCLWARGCGS